MAMKHSEKLPALEESPLKLSTIETGDELILDGRPFRVVYQTIAPFIRADGKGEHRCGFIGIEPA